MACLCMSGLGYTWELSNKIGFYNTIWKNTHSHSRRAKTGRSCELQFSEAQEKDKLKKKKKLDSASLKVGFQDD